MKPKIYLAGAISNLSHGACTDWRDAICLKLRNSELEGVSPMRGKDYLKSCATINTFNDDLPHPLSTSKGILTRDYFDVSGCDAVLVNLLGTKSVSVGTCIELGFAHAHRKPVVLVMEPDNIHAHPFVNQIAGYIVSTLDEAVDILLVMFNKKSQAEQKVHRDRLITCYELDD